MSLTRINTASKIEGLGQTWRGGRTPLMVKLHEHFFGDPQLFIGTIF